MRTEEHDQDNHVNRGQMKTITLVRHGKPLIWDRYTLLSLVNGKEIDKLLELQDYHGIVKNEKSAGNLHKIIKNADLFISSKLNRSKASFRSLGHSSV